MDPNLGLKSGRFLENHWYSVYNGRLKKLGSDFQEEQQQQKQSSCSHQQGAKVGRQKITAFSLHLGHCLKVLPALGRVSHYQLILLGNTLIDTPPLR